MILRQRESEEQRQQRLLRRREIERCQRQLQNEEQRAERLQRRRQNDQNHQQLEDDEQRDERRSRRRRRQLNETPQQRNSRLVNAKKAVAITNCVVQRSKMEGSREECKNLEIVVGSHSSVRKSPKKFCIDNEKVQHQCDEGDSVKVKSLDEIVQLAVHQRITIEGKVQSVEKIEKVKACGTMLDKQEVTIADATAAWRCVIWEKDINKLKEDNSYGLVNVTICTFNGSKYLSCLRSHVLRK